MKEINQIIQFITHAITELLLVLFRNTWLQQFKSSNWMDFVFRGKDVLNRKNTEIFWWCEYIRKLICSLILTILSTPCEPGYLLSQHEVVCGFLSKWDCRFIYKKTVSNPLSSVLQKLTVNVISFSEQETVGLCFSGKLDAILPFSLPQQKLHVNISLCHCSLVWK